MVSTTARDANALAALTAGRVTLAPVLVQSLDAIAACPDAIDECSRVIGLLQELDCDAETLAAAMWFYVAREQPATWRKAASGMPASSRRLVEGELAAERVWQLHAEHGDASEGLRRLLLAIIRDLRVVLVLLARQLARLRAADKLPAPEAQELARLTRDIHAPLANRLGIWQLKWELEDLAFRELQPATYKHIARLLAQRRSDREHFIQRCIGDLSAALATAGIDAELAGRPKHIYSIWKKMQRKHVDFADVYDVRAVRVLVDSVSDCYAGLGVVHAMWPHLPREFDDYVARPKDNGYRSLHTAVFGPEGRTLEVQIRTRDMHRTCELGVAAHWRYKEGGGADAAFEQRIAWMRRLLESRGDEEATLASAFRTELIEDRVYLLTPRGDVVDMAAGATVLDFAYRVHTEVGHRCRGAKVNGRIVPLTFQPASGDCVEVLTGKVSAPSRDWMSPHLGYLNTSRARDKVRAWFRRGEREANLAAGRAMFERELRRLALEPLATDTLLARLGIASQDALFEALALGEVTAGQVARAMHGPEVAPRPRRSELPPTPPDAADGLSIEGVGNLMTTLARCCQPLPGDQVRGFITRGRGISVHRADCPGLARLARRDPDRIIDVTWGQSADAAYQVDIVVRGYDRRDLHKDIVAVVTATATPIVASSSRTDPRRGTLEMRLTLRVGSFEELATLMARLEALPNVVEAARLTG